MTDDCAPGEDDVGDRATERQYDRAERVERIVEDFQTRLGDRSYPMSSTELGAEYADQPIDLPNETGTVGDVAEPVGDEFDSATETRETLYSELTGEAAGGEEHDPGSGCGGRGGGRRPNPTGGAGFSYWPRPATSLTAPGGRRPTRPCRRRS